MFGKFLDCSIEMNLGNLNFSSEYLIIEVRDDNKNWNSINEGVPNLEKCEYCSRYIKIRDFLCAKKSAIAA